MDSGELNLDLWASEVQEHVSEEAQHDVTKQSSVLPDKPQSQPDAKPAQVPLDGGLHAWIQVVGCFFCWFNSWSVSANPLFSQTDQILTLLLFPGA